MDTNFEPTIWAEDKLPQEAASYGQCEICTQKSRIIWGEGNPQAPIVIILDNPGAREDSDGLEFICGTRQTLQNALHQVGIAADNVYLTYLLKCRPLRKYNKDEVRAFSRPYLIKQIELMRPQFIVCLGDVVTRTMFEDESTSVKALRGEYHSILGIPCILSYHPLAVRRRPNLMRIFLDDLNMLAQGFLS